MGTETEVQGGPEIAPEPAPAPAPEPIMEEKKIPLIGLIGGLLMLIGLFLPWYSSGGLSLIGFLALPFSIIVLIFAILLIVFAATKKPFLVGIFGLLGFIIVLVVNLIIGGLITSWGGSGLSVWGVTTYGYYLSLVGGILGMIGGFMKK
jgi:hypothetical protein